MRHKHVLCNKSTIFLKNTNSANCKCISKVIVLRTKRSEVHARRFASIKLYFYDYIFEITEYIEICYPCVCMCVGVYVTDIPTDGRTDGQTD